jgi:hypothetical protein
MTTVAAIRDRLTATVPALAGRVEAAASLAALLQSDRLPQATPFAHIIPAEIIGGARRTAPGEFDQDLTHLWSVILTIRGDSSTGARALETLPEFLLEIIAALSGWVPVPGGHELAFRRCRLVTFQNGTFVYDLTFALEADLRIL